MLFSDGDEKPAASQLLAFGDTWIWNEEASEVYTALVAQGGPLSKALQAFWTFLGDNNLMAYLAMMAPRLIELRRVLKGTGSLHLHCDPTASHYLKMLLDAIFGVENFKNEISWRRTTTKDDHQQGPANFPRVRDTILYYSRDATAATKFHQSFAHIPLRT